MRASPGRGRRRALAAASAAALLGGAAAVLLALLSPAGGASTSWPVGSTATVRFSDPGVAPDAEGVWGAVDCESKSRARMIPGGGDRARMATGAPQEDSRHRRLVVLDGDDHYGERCELGENDHRRGPTALFRDGERLVTFASLRLPESFPLGTEDWQVVLQMKQAQPSANGDGVPVLALGAREGMWTLEHGTETLWSAPARHGTWTRFAFDVVYSADPDAGRITAHVDLNGDGDASDSGERSPPFEVSTLRRERAGGGADGIPAGAPIPSHLRIGIYHDEPVRCARPAGCAIDVDNVQVVAP